MEDHDEKEAALKCARKSKLCSKRSWCSIAFSSCCAVVLACIVAPSVFGLQRDTSVYNGVLSANSRVLLSFSSFYCERLSLSAGANTSLYVFTDLSTEIRPVALDQHATNFSLGLHNTTDLITVSPLAAYVTLTVDTCVNDERINNNTLIGVTFFNADGSGYKIQVASLVWSICNVNQSTFVITTNEAVLFNILFVKSDNNSYSNGTVRWTVTRNETVIALFRSIENCSNSIDAPCTLSIPFLSNDRVVLASSQQQNQVTVNCVTRPGSFVIIGILVFIVTLCVCLAILCPYIHCCFPKQKKHFGKLPNGYQRFRPKSDADERDAPRQDGAYLPPVVNNYPAPDPRPAPVNNYPAPDPRPAPVNNYPAPDPRPAQVNNYPAPDPRPAPVNNYPAPDPRPAPVNNYPAPVNNYPAPDPRPYPPRYPDPPPACI